MIFFKKTVDGCWRKVSTYLSIICIEDKKRTKLTSFAITIFSPIIFSVQQFWWLSIFLPLYPIVYCKFSKFCTTFDLLQFGMFCRCSSTISSKNCSCSSSVVMLLLKDCMKATSPRSAVSLVTFSPRTIDSPFWKSSSFARLIDQKEQNFRVRLEIKGKKNRGKKNNWKFFLSVERPFNINIIRCNFIRSLGIGK